MIKLLGTVDHNEVISTYNRIEKDIPWADVSTFGKQIGLQYDGTGDPWTGALNLVSGTEDQINVINPFFAGTIFEELINKYNLRRTRFLWINPWACYHMHKDRALRIHVPIITNPDCYFLFKEPEVLLTSLEPGNVYLADTKNYLHTYMNCSNHPRLHFVGSTFDYTNIG